MSNQTKFKLGDRLAVPELGITGKIVSIDPYGNPIEIVSGSKIVVVIGKVVERLPILIRLLQALIDLFTFK